MLENKNGIIFGVANKRSIAWATAQALHGAGACAQLRGDSIASSNFESSWASNSPGARPLTGGGYDDGKTQNNFW
jgi:hypothetical protein